MEIKIGDRIKINDVLNNGIIIKINKELGVCTVLWPDIKGFGNEYGYYQMFFIEEIEKINE